MRERAKEATRCGRYTYVEYGRFADDLVILIDAHLRHDWLLTAVEKHLRESLPIGVSAPSFALRSAVVPRRRTS